MAAVNILIGVGGTGAKTVEAALVLLASGGLEGTVHVCLVDQDGANGNVERTSQLLTRLSTFRTTWSRSNAKHYVGWPSPEMPGLGAIDVRPLFLKPEPNALWCPNSSGDSLRGIMGKNLPDGQQHLMDMLFLADDEEQNLRLDEGYRGRAHVGSAALVAALSDEKNKFLDRLGELMEDPSGQKVNIFLVGSSFGGTGAAGFPTLARRLHRMRQSEKLANRKNVMIGGLLLLPYFNFDKPDKPDEADQAVVTADELLPKAQLALEYYDSLFKHEQSFDRFYVLGWDRQFALGYHQPGAREQTNPALPPEMIAASAAIDFFQDALLDDQEPSLLPMASARQNRTVRWNDVMGGVYEAKLGQLLRFAAYWRYMFEPELQRKERLFGSNWARKLASGAQAAEAEQELNALRLVVGDILNWAATLEAMGGENDWGIGPWTLKAMLDPSHEATPVSPVRLRNVMSEDGFFAAFDRMVRFDSGKPVSRTAGQIYDELIKSVPPQDTHKGIGAAVAAVYHACRIGEQVAS